MGRGTATMPSGQPVVHGYRHSVYSWIARLTLSEKGVAYGWHEVDPFAADMPAEHRTLHPFGRVPALVHGGFTVYETVAIARYVDEAFDGPPLQPATPRRRARMSQAIAVIDSYGYRPLVRQVFAGAVFAPAAGKAEDRAEVAAGLAQAAPVLAALDALVAADGPFLAGDALSLADLHVAPMIGYFAMAPQGAEMLAGRSALSAWWTRMRGRDALAATWPPLPGAERSRPT
ncbi:glutathione S-transferase family protein, partial [Aquibium sp. A9E412]|uniref:glutathione S-transferase family protein n=1 Tax=Aquibium sp. A9E412 TaxID=2976767 RepID=UPI0025B11B53